MANREDWLQEAVKALDKVVLAPHGYNAPEVAISVGFPKGAKAIGQCFSEKAAADKKPHIFIHPGLVDLVLVLATVLHELIHASIGTEAKHGKEFKTAMKKVGLEGKATHTHAGIKLAATLETLAAELGPYPHGALVPEVKEKKGSPLKLWLCHCAPKPFKVRVAVSGFDATCNKCGKDFVREESDGEEKEPS